MRSSSAASSLAGRHRLHRVQRPDLSALRRAARRARRGVAALRDELLGAQRRQGPRVQRHHRERRCSRSVATCCGPRSWRMVRDILRFNRQAPQLLLQAKARLPLGECCARQATAARSSTTTSYRWARRSGPPARRAMFGFPARFFVRFLMNHGMLTVNDRPQWRTIRRLGALRGEAHGAVPRPHPAAHAGGVDPAPARRGDREGARHGAGALRRGVHGLPQRPGAALLADPTRPSARCWARFPTSATRPSCTPTAG